MTGSRSTKGHICCRSHADILITSLYKDRQLVQSRNDIRFRGYQKFGAELKIIDESMKKPPPEKARKIKQAQKTRPALIWSVFFLPA